MLIHTLHSLVLLNGVDCILTKLPSQNHPRVPVHLHVHVLPISKCEILGIIQYCQYKANGSVNLIIDDGTGLCDCIGWIDDSEEMDQYRVCDLVRISGAIRVLSLKEKSMVNVEGILYEGWTCMRELHVHSMNMEKERNMEAVHWLHCLQFRKRIGVSIGIKEQGKELQEMNGQSQIMNTPVCNGLETFNMLPEDAKNQILSSRGTEDSFVRLEGDEYFLAKYYGRDCRCDMKYKAALLYCHCLATKEPLDPGFKFRDSLLETLLEMELLSGSGAGEASNEGRTVGADLRDGNNILEFSYVTVFQHPQLQDVAEEIVSNTKDPNINLRRLFTNTFRHLRNDSVVYLTDPNADTYLLMSKDRVLLPAVQRIEIEKDQWEYRLKMTGKQSKDPPRIPKFLESVSSAKLWLVKRLVARQRKQS